MDAHAFRFRRSDDPSCGLTTPPREPTGGAAVRVLRPVRPDDTPPDDPPPGRPGHVPAQRLAVVPDAVPLPVPVPAAVLPLPAGTQPEAVTAELLALVAKGDSEAWSVIHGRYRGLVVGVARRYRLSPPDVDDVIQRTWLRLLQHAADIREPERVAGWISTTARRECLALKREQSRLRPVADLPEEGAAPAEDACDRLVAAETAQALHAAVRRLPERQRRLLETLLATPDLPYEEVGRRLGMPIGSIGPTRQRALGRLRQILEDGGVDGLAA